MKRAMRRRKTWQRQAAALTAAMMAMSVGGIAYAMPQGEVIRSGKGEITRQDKDMTVNQDSKHLAIDWAGFDIANDERVTFRQPDRDSVALNRVVGDAASVIDGALSGNGHVYVINPNGVLFGKNASVDVGSLVASTARISDRDMTNFAGADGITMAIPEDQRRHDPCRRWPRRAACSRGREQRYDHESRGHDGSCSRAEPQPVRRYGRQDQLYR